MRRKTLSRNSGSLNLRKPLDRWFFAKDVFAARILHQQRRQPQAKPRHGMPLSVVLLAPGDGRAPERQPVVGRPNHLHAGEGQYVKRPAYFSFVVWSMLVLVSVKIDR